MCGELVLDYKQYEEKMSFVLLPSKVVKLLIVNRKKIVPINYKKMLSFVLLLRIVVKLLMVNWCVA